MSAFLLEDYPLASPYPGIPSITRKLVSEYPSGPRVAEGLSFQSRLGMQDPRYCIRTPNHNSNRWMIPEEIEVDVEYNIHSGKVTKYNVFVRGIGYSKVLEEVYYRTGRRSFVGAGAIADDDEMPRFIKDLIGHYSPEAYAGFFESQDTFKLRAPNEKVLTVREALLGHHG